ncbi:MAG: hypothetical protein JKY65_22055 [Planctomycetes bacterium]|nr:hypothetical protein [Planctomycetota bacterium]
MFDRCEARRGPHAVLALVALCLLGCKDEKTKLPFLFVETPSAVVEGQTPVFYTLVQQESKTTTVVADFTTDLGQTFQKATLAPDSPRLDQLVSRPEGERFNFFWDPLTDLGPGLHRNVILSLFGAGNGSRASQTAPFSVDLSDRLSPLSPPMANLTLERGTAIPLADGSILLGGLESQGRREAGLLRYLPYTQQANSAGSMSQPRSELGAARLAKGDVLFAGGRSDSGESASVDLWTITPSGSSQVGLAGTLATPRIAPLVAPLADGRALVLGGHSIGGTTTAAVELFTPGSGITPAYSSPLAARAGATATRLGDGRVLIAGGAGAGGLVQLTALVSGASLAQITTGSKIGVPRVEHVAVLLPDGRVFLVGGSLALGDDAQALPSAELFDPATGTTTVVASMSRKRRLPAAAYTDGSIVVFGGTGSTDSPTTAERYELQTNTWHELAAPSGTVRTRAIAATTGPGYVLVMGGGQPAERYHPDADLLAAGTYDFLVSLPAPRADHTATALNDQQVLIVGGTDGIRTAVSSVEVFDLLTQTFTARGSLRRARSDHGATETTSRQILVAGGVDELGKLITETELYSPGTNTWEDAGAIQFPRRNATLSCFGPLHAPIYGLVGGVDASGNPVAEVESWDEGTRTWKTIATLANPRTNHQVAITRSYFFVGPGDGATGPQDDLQRLDPFNGLSRISLTLASPRAGASLSFFREPSRLVIAGGRDATGAPVGSLLTVDPDATSPTIIPGTIAMITPRSDHLSIRLDEFFGEILFIGGRGASGLAQDESEILRLTTRETNTSTVQGTINATSDRRMNRARIRHTATQLRNRRVLIVGGVDERGSVISGAELFLP